MTKLVKPMTPLCSIHDVDCRTLAEKHVLGIEKDPSRNVEFIPADEPYSVLRD